MEKNKRILIVDDQQDLREQLAKLLKRAGKKSETTSFVQQMRQRLSGAGAGKDAPASDEKDASGEDAYAVKVAAQGEEAFNMVKKALEDDKPYAVLFTDMRMPPGWDGLETAKRIRDIDKNIEIVIMTAYADHDQATIADTVGCPEKLLYIKKPFQAEEIYQLALCLTSKWNAEELQRSRREWLESVVRSMSKVKTAASGRDGRRQAYSTALKAILSFTAATKGFLCVWNDQAMCWEAKCLENVDEKEAAAFISENEARLTESKTTQSFQGRYLLPLKRDGFSAVVVIYDIVTQSDPEWYKLMTLLSMTASEALSGAALSETALQRERGAALESALSVVLAAFKDFASKTAEAARKDDAVAAEISKIQSEFMSEFASLELSEEKGGNCSKIKMFQLLDEAFAAAGGGKIKIDKKTEGSDLEVSVYPDQLKKAFTNIFASLACAAGDNGKSETTFTVDVNRINNMAVVSVSAPGVNVPADAVDKVFEPFSARTRGGGKFGLGMHAARRIVQNHSGNVQCLRESDDLCRVVVRIPSPQS